MCNSQGQNIKRKSKLNELLKKNGAWHKKRTRQESLTLT